MISINKPPMLEGRSAEEDIAAIRSYLYSIAEQTEQQLNNKLDQLDQTVASISSLTELD